MYVNNSLFISMCILSNLPQQKNPRGLCWVAPQFYMFSRSNANISFLRNRKEVRKSKESCLCKGRFPYLWVLLRFKNTLGLMPSGALPLGQRTHTRTSLTTWSLWHASWHVIIHIPTYHGILLTCLVNVHNIVSSNEHFFFLLNLLLKRAKGGGGQWDRKTCGSTICNAGIKDPWPI